MVTGMAPPVVTWQDIRAWQEICGYFIEPWEARTLIELGLLRARVAGEKAEAERKAK